MKVFVSISLCVCACACMHVMPLEKSNIDFALLAIKL